MIQNSTKCALHPTCECVGVVLKVSLDSFTCLWIVTFVIGEENKRLTEKKGSSYITACRCIDFRSC